MIARAVLRKQFFPCPGPAVIVRLPAGDFAADAVGLRRVCRRRYDCPGIAVDIQAAHVVVVIRPPILCRRRRRVGKTA